MAAASANMTFTEKPDLNQLEEKARQKLTNLLRSIRGTKDVVIDPDLLPLLEIIAGAKLLKSHDVDKIFKLENQITTRCNSKRIYLIYPHIHKAKIIADHINADKNSEKKQLLWVEVVMIPRKLYCCEEVLEYEGVFGDITIRSLDLGFIPIQRDVLSLDIPWFNKDFFLHKDQTSIHSIASALHVLQCHFGEIPYICTHGEAAKLVADMLKNIFSKLGDTKKLSGEISHLFILDRSIDYPSALLSQLTYEGQLDETFSIKNGMISLAPEDTGKKQEIKLKLSGDDEIFQEIKDAHIIKAFEILSKKVKELVSNSMKRQEMTVGEMKAFVSSELKRQQQEHKSISSHIDACEVIFKKNMLDQVQERMTVERNIIEGVSYKDTLNFLEENIILKAPMLQNLRLLCLLSLTQDGLQAKDYKSIRSKFLQSYGYHHLLTFFNLKKMGLLVEQEIKPLPTLRTAFVEQMASAAAYRVGGSTFHSYSKKLNLIPKPDVDYDAKNPVDPAYVFGGMYIPLACNLITQILEKEDNPTSIEDTLRTVPGPYEWRIRSQSARGKGGNTSIDTRVPSSRVVLVLFLGGITFAEIAAFRLLGRMKGYRFILATTSIINGKTLINSVIEEFKLMKN